MTLSQILAQTFDYLQTTLVFFIIVDNPITAAENLNTDLDKISQWAGGNLVGNV